MAILQFGLVAILGLAFCPCAASAQAISVVVKGVVTHQTGAVLQGATVTLTNRDTGLSRTSITDSSGNYQVPPVPAGRYDLMATLDGFRPTVRELVLHVGETVTLDLPLATAGSSLEVEAKNSIEVVALAPVLRTTENTLAHLVGKEKVDVLPVVDRNFNTLATLAPAVSATGVYGGVEIGGSRDFQNGYNVDGASSEGLARGQPRLAFAQDWIQEFQVLASQYNVEFGGASGGIVNVITRSGSNDTSGRVYGFFRNELWDATPAFASSKAPLRMTRLGGTAGGRLAPARLFFFTGFEWFDDATSSVVNSSFPEWNGSMPTTTDQKLFMLKLEGHHGNRDTWRVRYNLDTRSSTNVGVGGIRTEQNGLSSADRALDVVGTWSRVVSSSMFNELRSAFSSTIADTSCDFAAHNPPGTWFQRAYPGALLGCRFGFGWINLDELQFIDSLSWARGVHDIKAGVLVSRGRSYGDYRNLRDGIYRFDRDLPFSLADPASYPYRFNVLEGGTVWDYSQWSWGIFIQDSWRMTPDLTLNLGIRYDLDGSYTALNPWIRADKGLNTVRLDADNFAPRAGLVWTPFDNDRRTRLRAGAGVYYDENHENVARVILFNSVLVDRSIVLDATLPFSNPFYPDAARLRRELAEALARNSIPDLTGLPPETGNSPELERDLQVPFTIQTSGGVAHDFGRGWTLSADVLVSRGLDQYLIYDANVGRDALGRFFKLNPLFSRVSRYGNGARFTYRGLLIHLGFAPTAGHVAGVSYTLSKNESNTRTLLDGSGPEQSFSATNPFDYKEDFGPADNDIRHNLSAHWVTTLPYGFQLSGIVTARSALPWSVATEQLDSDPFLDRPEPRNSRRGDGLFTLDARLTKAFRIGGRSMAAFVESFNATNATNLTGYVTRRSGAQFGLPTAALERRRVQLGLRLDF